MFKSVARLLSRRAGPRRDIFVYHDGARERRADPMVLWERLRTDPECDLAIVLPASARGEPEAMREHEAFIRRVFDIPLYDPEADTGLPILELHDLFARFMAYMEDLKKKRDLRPIKSPPSASRSSETPGTSTTPPAADSCSTADESSAAEAT